MYDATLKKFCSFFFLVNRKNRFYVTVGLYSNRLHKMSKYGKNISYPRGYASCATFLFSTHLTSSMIYFWAGSGYMDCIQVMKESLEVAYCFLDFLWKVETPQMKNKSLCWRTNKQNIFTTHLFLPLHPYTSMYILYTVLRTISIGAGKQNFVRLLRTSVVVNHFLYSCDHIQGWYCKEKLDTNHTQGSKGESRCVDLRCGLSLFSFSNEGTLSSLRK